MVDRFDGSDAPTVTGRVDHAMSAEALPNVAGWLHADADVDVHVGEPTPVCALRTGLSPRLGPVDARHVASLVEVIDFLPPILVHRATYTVVDGAHRLEAHRLGGRDLIKCVFVDGDLDESFVTAVVANVSHGLPLTMAERRNAAGTILVRFPERSDRWVGDVCGLSHTTVGTIRRDLSSRLGLVDAHTREGRDGRRRRTERPHADCRDLSAVSPETPGLDPTAGANTPQRRGARGARTPRPPVITAHPSATAVRRTSDDDALLAVAELRDFISWMDAAAICPEDWEPYVELVPMSRLYELADDCRRRAEQWMSLTNRLEARARGDGLH